MRVVHAILLVLLTLALPVSRSRAQGDVAGDEASAPVDRSLDGHGTSRWGYVPARNDSNLVAQRDIRTPAWETIINVPWYIVSVPLGWINDGVGHGVESFMGSTTGLWLQNALRVKDVAYGVAINPSFGGLDAVDLQFTFFHNEFFSPKNRTRIAVRFGNRGSFKAYYGDDYDGMIDWGVGYRLRENTPYYGIGPLAANDGFSLYTEELAWGGAAIRYGLGQSSSFEVRGAVNSMTTRGPGDDDYGPSIEDVWADDLPFGYGELSRAALFGFIYNRDTTKQTGRPSSGGIQRVRGQYTGVWDGAGADHWLLRGEAQQFFKLWKSERTLALRGTAVWIESLGGPIYFNRLFWNDDPDLLRGYIDYRWRDRGFYSLNAEYRWPVWANTEATGTGVDMYVFTDIGQVFDDGNQIALDLLTESFGIGFRMLGGQENLIFRLDLGWSDEQFVARLRTDQVFQYIKHTFYHGRRPAPAR